MACGYPMTDTELLQLASEKADEEPVGEGSPTWAEHQLARAVLAMWPVVEAASYWRDREADTLLPLPRGEADVYEAVDEYRRRAP